jgi:flagellar M-ring protein FliF
MAEELTTEPTQEIAAPEVTTEEQPIERKNLVSLIKEWPLSRKISLGAVIFISVLLFGFLIYQGRTADYQLLYANLNDNDAAPVVEWLKGQKIPYQLKNNGRDIWIPANQLYETRLNLASNGLPNVGGVGFEVFDKQSFALTDYVQKVNYTRALQGELSRTITTLEPVVNARVHLALPEKRLFKNQQKAATASVILSLTPGKNLDKKQVLGIVHLVAGSVTGLNAKNVKVIDSNGVVLDSEIQQEKDKFLSVDMLAYQQEVEHRLEMRAQDLLDKTMGKNMAMVRVNASLDFSKVEKTQELFDAEEPVIRSEQVNQETNGAPSSGGIPGVQSNLQGNLPLDQSTSSSSSRTSRTTNYEISKTVSKIINPVGNILNLSVSILVADTVIPETKDEPAGTKPRTEQELKSLETMVAAALGLDSERGDKINILSMPFTDPLEDGLLVGADASPAIYQYLPAIKFLGLAVLALALYLLLVRPIIKTMKGEVEEHYKTVEELERERIEQLTSAEDDEITEIVEDAAVLLRREVMKDPTATAYVLKNWIQET